MCWGLTLCIDIVRESCPLMPSLPMFFITGESPLQLNQPNQSIQVDECWSMCIQATLSCPARVQQACCLQAALAAEEDEPQPSGRDFDDSVSEASSAVSGMSAYGGSTTAGTSVTSSTGQPVSTVGGKKPFKRKQKKVFWLSYSVVACNLQLRHKLAWVLQWLHSALSWMMPAKLAHRMSFCCPGCWWG